GNRDRAASATQKTAGVRSEFGHSAGVTMHDADPLSAEHYRSATNARRLRRVTSPQGEVRPIVVPGRAREAIAAVALGGRGWPLSAGARAGRAIDLELATGCEVAAVAARDRLVRGTADGAGADVAALIAAPRPAQVLRTTADPVARSSGQGVDAIDGEPIDPEVSIHAGRDVVVVVERDADLLRSCGRHEREGEVGVRRLADELAANDRAPDGDRHVRSLTARGLPEHARGDLR